LKIVVLGAGTVGTSIAGLLCQNGHSVTVVDNDPVHLRRVNEELDVRVVAGSASASTVLFQADILGADICLAVTGNDEVNLVGACMSKALGVRRTIARVYGPVFRDLSTFDYQKHFCIDRLLSLEHLSALELARGIRNPGSLAVEGLAAGQLEVQELTIDDRAPSAGKCLMDLKLAKDVRVGSIAREGRMWIAGAADVLQAGDRVTLIGRREHLDKVRGRFQVRPEPKVSVVIAGGGETGYHLAQCLDSGRYRVLVMEARKERCEYLAHNLDHVTVVQADATRKNVLEEERVGSADVFAACIGDDENNIMACVEAREIGARTLMAIVGRPDYANVVGKLGIDLAVSPRKVMAKQILGFLTTGPIISQTSLAAGRIGVYEVEVLAEAAITEHPLAGLKLPTQALIVAVIREQHVRVPGAKDRLRAGDTAIVLVEESSKDAMLAMFTPRGR
jgi:trk system potassium uptake protein TrkA